MDSAVLRDLDHAQDRVWMREAAEEIDAVPSHKLRIAVFLSAMSHYRDALSAKGLDVDYRALAADSAKDEARTLGEHLARTLREDRPERVRVVLPGDWRVLEQLQAVTASLEVPLDVLADEHFYVSPEQFDAWARGKKSLLLEHFYRHLRKREGVLIDADDKPVGGAWNYDADNRQTFGKGGPPELPPLPRFELDAISREVAELVNQRFAKHPGHLDHLDQVPVTAAQATASLDDFIEHRLDAFGPFEDALWGDEHFLFHSRLSVPLNLKLLPARAAVAAAVSAHREGRARLASVEGFVRQVLGWREFIRGIYWRFMPDYAERNFLECSDRDVPSFFWDGETDMECVRSAMGSVLDHGYAHHIRRLMVLGLFAQLAGVHPFRFHQWHMAMYLDAVDWVSLPNTLGMSQFGDGGVVGTKPYCATGRYIDRMSNHCKACRYKPGTYDGADACPFSALYWDFLARHHDRFEGNPRMAFQVRNLRKKGAEELAGIRRRAAAVLDDLEAGRRV